MAPTLLADYFAQDKLAQDKAAEAKSAQTNAAHAKAVLGRSRIFDLRCLVVEQDGECVALRGSVDSYYHKQLAQELLKTAIPGIEVINLIKVEYRPDRVVDHAEWN